VNRHSVWILLLLIGLTSSQIGCSGGAGGDSTGSASGKTSVTLLNVSYDPTREFYQDFNKSFSDYWKKQKGVDVTVDQSHGGSGKQARGVIDGLEADVVSLALAQDIDSIAQKANLLDSDWQSKLPNNSCPYTSTIVFLVRKGNPKGIKDWNDLVKGDVSIITPNPKTGGGARWNYLAAWGFALKKELGDLAALRDDAKKAEVEAAQAKAKQFVTDIYKRVAVLDSAARGATNTFLKNELGDVLITWENEAFLALKETGSDSVEIVVPSLSILAEPPVAVISKNAEKHKTSEVAEAYLKHLYSPQGQQLAAKHFYRPSVAETLTPDELKKFAQVELFNIKDVFGGWAQAQKVHFDDGGVFDQIYQPGK
jgi:sulfate/thiosulfate transport system substrate-binding protein